MAEPARVPYQAAARSLLRDTVVGAVDDLVRARGWASTTMADVARAAGVSRQTLYNEFGSRPSLIQAYVAREVETMIGEVSEAVRAHADDAHAALREAFALFLRLASDEPVVRTIVAGGADGAVGAELITALTDVGQALAATRIAVLVPEVWPQITDDDAQLLAGSLVRLAISHALLPTADPDEIAAGVGRMFSPFVEQILAV
ncbi:TetR family transcriptional regulator [Jatrophihabitans endophyticus]|uniref:TetR family transcriptional regulator n=1 Tax=Jatrophihabitans endophyticus TaxID=1206085 RepID=UPI0019F04495|nr:TetR family transcriptional regulator [Jatrophihabitans endophyticus]MBE7189393.1 TetR family transcriptional regulator [Jatrophihabitans endophyticus]